MKQKWTIKELSEHWTLAPDEIDLVSSLHHKNRLGFSVLLKFFQLEGRFPHTKGEVPKACVAFVAEQIELPVELFFNFFKYDWDDRNSRNHRAEIRTYCGFREATTNDKKKISDWLVSNYISAGANEQHVQVAAYQRFKELKRTSHFCVGNC